MTPKEQQFYRAIKQAMTRYNALYRHKRMPPARASDIAYIHKLIQRAQRGRITFLTFKATLLGYLKITPVGFIKRLRGGSRLQLYLYAVLKDPQYSDKLILLETLNELRRTNRQLIVENTTLTRINQQQKAVLSEKESTIPQDTQAVIKSLKEEIKTLKEMLTQTKALLQTAQEKQTHAEKVMQHAQKLAEENTYFFTVLSEHAKHCQTLKTQQSEPKGNHTSNIAFFPVRKEQVVTVSLNRQLLAAPQSEQPLQLLT